jgi:hypothetical protein
MDDGRAHRAPLERGMIMIESYKHGAPPEHFAHCRQSTKHFSCKATCRLESESLADQCCIAE